ncbi:DUF72 domain-containing protein [Neolewinella agarilytica]|uniref:Uncharacterized conserved protein YecE, DUF72 family n=1 Tax=Neolewinella agarilytica TaxID=478744 RepID=A0A1H9KW80_9BACT|nr:DUF72 domain-containing protein [Neolewinella agarilytica]SER03444.1 Uncharacterized conserved protein YecE, DUF72 family [Neolewinella agarilytica]
MKFGKASDLSSIHFELPLDPLANRSRLDRYELGADGERPNIFIGATGWSMKKWVGKWYPDKTKTADYLKHYGEQFNTIELNTTHYRIPDAETIRRWYETVPADFRFCPKVPQSISHRNDFGMNGGELQQFVGSLDGLKEKMGCAFVQLPPYFGADRLRQLESFLDRWPRLLPLAVEVRHESWFADPFATEALMDALASRQIAAVITDVAGRRDVLHNYITAPRTMIRFVGNGLIPTDYSRMKEWADKLKEWNLPETYFFPHQPDNILSPDASAWFSQHLSAMNFATVRGPSEWAGPEQMSLF